MNWGILLELDSNGVAKWFQDNNISETLLETLHRKVVIKPRSFPQHHSSILALYLQFQYISLCRISTAHNHLSNHIHPSWQHLATQFTHMHQLWSHLISTKSMSLPSQNTCINDSHSPLTWQYTHQNISQSPFQNSPILNVIIFLPMSILLFHVTYLFNITQSSPHIVIPGSLIVLENLYQSKMTSLPSINLSNSQDAYPPAIVSSYMTKPMVG
jgi:hypothetical protein